MILLHTNCKLNDDVISNLVSTYKKDKYLPEVDNFYTNYYHKDTEDFILKDYYKNNLKVVLQHLGLENRCEYKIDQWVQVYDNKTEGFGYHDHFTGTEFLSWIHFIKVPKQKCFHFIDSLGNKQYPDNQSDGDFLVFPSWALHAADKVEEEFDRVVVSGNISIKHYISSPVLWSTVEDESGVRWNCQSMGQTLNP